MGSMVLASLLTRACWPCIYHFAFCLIICTLITHCILLVVGVSSASIIVGFFVSPILFMVWFNAFISFHTFKILISCTHLASYSSALSALSQAPRP